MTSLTTVAREWLRIGMIGFGGPPSHISLLRRLTVERRAWLTAAEFEDANAACQLLPGPASTQLAIYCALRVRGRLGALVGGACFIAPAVAAVLALSLLFLARSPPSWVLGVGDGAGSAVPVIALCAALSLARPSLRRETPGYLRWMLYAAAGAAGALWLGPYLALVLLSCGLTELALRRPSRGTAAALLLPPATVGAGGLGALCWMSLKVGALAFGGGFVIVPLMQGDAVHAYHWMSNARFLDAVALGQVTPGPVVATVAAVGYAAHGVGGALLAAAVAFAPSFAIVLGAGGALARLRSRPGPRAFLDGAGPAAIGAIAGAAVTLAVSLHDPWRYGVLAAAALSMLVFRRGLVFTIVAAGIAGAILVQTGVVVPG